MAAPLFAVLGSGKFERIHHPVVLAMIAFGAVSFMAAMVLAGRLARRAIPTGDGTPTVHVTGR